MPPWLKGDVVRHVFTRYRIQTSVSRFMDKSLTTTFSRMTHSYRAYVSTLDGRSTDTAVYKRQKLAVCGA